MLLCFFIDMMSTTKTETRALISVEAARLSKQVSSVGVSEKKITTDSSVTQTSRFANRFQRRAGLNKYA